MCYFHGFDHWNGDGISDEKVIQNYNWLVYAGHQKQENADLHSMRQAVFYARKMRKVASPLVPDLNDPRFEAMQESYRAERLQRQSLPKISSDEMKQKVIHEIERICIQSASSMEPSKE